MSARQALLTLKEAKMATHEPEWVEDPSKSNETTIVFKCSHSGCRRTQSVSRKQYELGRAFPSLSNHS